MKMYLTSCLRSIAACCLLWLVAWCPPLLAQGVPVTVTEVTEAPVYRELRLTGTVTSARSAELSVSVGGLVQNLLVEEGAKVESGDLLLELDPELAELEWQAASAAAEQAKVDFEDARRRLGEVESLSIKDSIAETEVRNIRAEVASREAQLAAARAQAASRRAVLDRHTLRAPFDGVINSKLTEVGQWVTPGQAVLGLIEMDSLRVDFAVSEEFLPGLTPNAQISFRLNAIPDRRYQGRIATIVPVTDPGARTFLLRVKPEHEGDGMLPGMSAEATLKLDTGEQGLAIPRDAMLRYPDGRIVAWVLVENDDGAPTAQERRIRIGHAFDGMIEIIDGLAPGEKVVVRGNEGLQHGQLVRVITTD